MEIKRLHQIGEEEEKLYQRLSLLYDRMDRSQLQKGTLSPAESRVATKLQKLSKEREQLIITIIQSNTSTRPS